MDVAKAAEGRVIPEELCRRAERISTYPPPAIIGDQIERYAMASRLLARVSSAELVVTRRLHIALPCISLGTPVVILAEARYGKARRRYQGFEEISPITFLDDVERLSEEQFADLATHKPIIPAALETHYASLLERLTKIDRLSAAVEPLEGPSSIERRAPNPDRAARPRDVVLSCGSLCHRARVTNWSDRQIRAEAPRFLGADRFDMTLTIA